MSKAGNTQRWFAGWRKAARPDAYDPADHGTAFGLEMSLPDTAPLPGPGAPEVGRARKAGWMGRFGARAKTVA